jgi:WhiB family redox-sensing transcriptional regulator
MTSATTLPDPARVAEDQGIVTPCRDPRYNPDAWHCEGRTIPGRARIDAAINLCSYACPVQALCRDWAVARNEPHGVWGGLTVSQRQTLRRGGHLRDLKARWLAGQTDHDGNPLPAAETEQAADESDTQPAA